MTPEELLTLRTDLVDALYQSAGCQIIACTGLECCIDLARIKNKARLEYGESENGVLVHADDDLVSYEERSMLEFIQILTKHECICRKNIFEGFSEVPMPMGEMLGKNNSEWDRRLREHATSSVSNALHILFAKEFLFELTILALPDDYLSGKRDSQYGTN